MNILAHLTIPSTPKPQKINKSKYLSSHQKKKMKANSSPGKLRGNGQRQSNPTFPELASLFLRHDRIAEAIIHISVYFLQINCLILAIAQVQHR